MVMVKEWSKQPHNKKDTFQFNIFKFKSNLTEILKNDILFVIPK